MDTIVYIDGFNFYYGCVAGTPYKWLNLPRLCEKLLPNNRVVGIKYFTAKVKGRRADPSQGQRQAVYFRALETDPRVQLIMGHFLTNAKFLPRADGKGVVEVVRTEEKGSDVNLASHIVHDAHMGRFEVAALMSNDSDLAEPVRIVTQEVGLRLGVLYPTTRPKRHPSRVLGKYATFKKSIRAGVLKDCQFPDELEDSAGKFRKPVGW